MPMLFSCVCGRRISNARVSLTQVRSVNFQHLRLYCLWATYMQLSEMGDYMHVCIGVSTAASGALQAMTATPERRVTRRLPAVHRDRRFCVCVSMRDSRYDICSIIIAFFIPFHVSCLKQGFPLVYLAFGLVLGVKITRIYKIITLSRRKRDSLRGRGGGDQNGKSIHGAPVRNVVVKYCISRPSTL